jgi:hypothetical protein
MNPMLVCQLRHCLHRIELLLVSDVPQERLTPLLDDALGDEEATLRVG